MAKARLLPESCYDFWAYDCRDGERCPKRNSLRAARADARAMRRRLKRPPRIWIPAWVEVVWKVSEMKVLNLLKRKRSHGPK